MKRRAGADGRALACAAVHGERAADGVQPILEKTAPDLAKSELIFPSADYTAKCSPSLSPPGSKQDEQEVEKAWSALTVG